MTVARAIVCAVLLSVSAFGGWLIGRSLYVGVMRQPQVIAAQPVTHAATLRLVLNNGLCSGTAIGKHKILTATHCMTGSTLVAVNQRPVKVGARVDDGKDHTILTVDIDFIAWAKVAPNKIKQGDRIRFWGNPQGIHDQYREGVISGSDQNREFMDVTIGHGDSGAGVFNTAGEVVGVVSAVGDADGFRLGVMYPIAFDSSSKYNVRQAN